MSTGHRSGTVDFTEMFNSRALQQAENPCW